MLNAHVNTRTNELTNMEGPEELVMVVSQRTLLRRLNRVLAKESMVVRVNRTGYLIPSLGRFYLEDRIHHHLWGLADNREQLEANAPELKSLTQAPLALLLATLE